jgi:hypothetical protein
VKDAPGSGIGPAYYKTENAFTSSFVKPPPASNLVEEGSGPGIFKGHHKFVAE